MLLDKGLSRLDALETASELAKVDMTGAVEKKRRMSIPQPSTKFNPKTADPEAMPFSEAVKAFPEEQLIEHMIKLVK